MLKCFDNGEMKNKPGSILKLLRVGVILLLFLPLPVLGFSPPPDKDQTPLTTDIVQEEMSPTLWPMFHGDERRSGNSPEMFIKAPLSVKWVFSTGGNIWSSPAISHSICYIGSSDGKIYAVNIKSGESVWEFQTGDAVYSSPAVANNIVYVGSLDRKLYALDAITGQVKWYIETDEPITSSPCVSEGIVYIGSWDGTLYAADAYTGAIKWKFQTKGPIYSSPAVFQNYVYIGSSDDNVYALDKVKGTSVWTFTTGDYVSASPCISDKIVYIGSWDKYMYALNYQTGSVVWKYKCEEGIYNTPAASGDLLVFGTYGGTLYAMNKARGYVVWTYKAQKSAYHSSPVIANGIIYIGLGYNNKVQAFNLKTGEFIWSHITGASVGSTPAIANTMMFIASSDGRIYAFGDTTPPLAKARIDKKSQSSVVFTVNWSGVDEGGSQIKSFDIQYREGGGEEWKPWLTNVATTFAVFGPATPIVVRDGRAYYFQARATDNAGNLGSYAGGEGDVYTTIDMSPPSIVNVEVDRKDVKPSSYVSPTPLITAKIIDNVGVDPEKVQIIINKTVYKPDSFSKGVMTYRHKDTLSPGFYTITIIASDISGNKSVPWEVRNLKVSVGIAIENLKVAPEPFNPLAGPTYIYYSLNANANMILYIYDKFGSLIYSSRFAEGIAGGRKGYNKIEWKGTSSSGAFVQNGVYTYKLIANQELVGKGVITVQQ